MEIEDEILPTVDSACRGLRLIGRPLGERLLLYVVVGVGIPFSIIRGSEGNTGLPINLCVSLTLTLIDACTLTN